MHIKSAWSYVNKGLLIILSFLVISTLASLVYLTYTLLNIHEFTTRGSNAVATAFVLQDLYSNVQDLESSAKGYALVDDPSFLARYNSDKQRIPLDLKSVQTDKQLLLTKSQINQITALVNQKVSFMDQVVTSRDTDGLDASQALIATKSGETTMSQLGNTLNAISSVGLQDIGPLRTRADMNFHRALVVTAAMAVFTLGTCAAVIWYFQRTILHERALESTKNEFLSLASHQLRTPATNVKQYLGLLMDGYMGDLSEQQRNALQIAYKNNESEISIMNNLLDVAKLDLERIQLHKKITNIMSTARHVVSDHAVVAKEKQQKIELEGPKQVMASVDESYIRGVLENLIDNAIKYSKPGTHIHVSVSREQDNAIIAVSDQGIGIRKRDYVKLFNKFSRLDNEFSANSQGSGLGLYWVKQIVGLHRGTVDVNSREGKGSVFTVRLPVR
jgi:signal transduction histidine kinase